jgi:hypothetical protein
MNCWRQATWNLARNFVFKRTTEITEAVRVFDVACDKLTLKSAVFWIVAPCRSEKARTTFRMNISTPFSGSKFLHPTSAGSLLVFLFDRKDGGDMFLRNVGLCLKLHSVTTQRNRTLQSHSCEKENE